MTKARRQQLGLQLLVDHRWRTELATATLVTVAAVGTGLFAGTQELRSALPAGTRAAVYTSFTASAAALLGFVLTALSILVALPSGERVSALQRNVNWGKLPESFLRAATLLLLALVLSSAALVIDTRPQARLWVEGPVLFVVTWGLVRVSAALVVLSSLLAVAVAERGDRPRPRDP